MEQEQQIAVELAISRHRAVPPGFAGLRKNCGAILRERRKTGGYGKQWAVAADIGISAPALSRIENGRTIPRLETIDALLLRLELDWSAVAIVRENAHEAHAGETSRRRDRLFETGQDIRNARQYAGLTLRQLASLSGISLAHLSRIERGANASTLIYQEHLADSGLDRDSRQITIVHPMLLRLVEHWRTGKTGPTL